ncbi:unnamed protein product [Clavelina lepadiformis]|uniref:COMM domain-containing protein n=1 Tax=Clavelina lepadiformis TaxID=159417 RepID=A0ABP0FAF4_CLALP
MAEQIFTETSRFKTAVQLINELESNRFPKLLSRIAEKLHLREEHAFSEEEQIKLQLALGIGSEDRSLLLETIEFILLQAAYYGLKPATLHQHLLSVNLSVEKSEIISQTWASYGKATVEKMKKHSFTHSQLESVSWHLNLQLAQDNKTQVKESNAIFHLNLKKSEIGKAEKLSLELTHKELLHFYNKLEILQDQLDSLS